LRQGREEERKKSSRGHSGEEVLKGGVREMVKVVMKKRRRKGFREKRKVKHRSEEFCGNLDF
jgi:hypothetical protein